MWKRFRQTGEEKPILPAVPTGTICAFAGLKTRIPGGWLDLTAGPYFASEYEALALLFGVNGAYVALPTISDRAVVGVTATEDVGVTGGVSTVSALTAAQSGLRNHSDHSMGMSHNHGSKSLSGHTHKLYYNNVNAFVGTGPQDGVVTVLTVSNLGQNPTYSSGDSGYGITLDSNSTDATIDDYVSDAAETHTNLQPSLEMLFIVKT